MSYITRCGCVSTRCFVLPKQGLNSKVGGVDIKYLLAGIYELIYKCVYMNEFL